MASLGSRNRSHRTSGGCLSSYDLRRGGAAPAGGAHLGSNPTGGELPIVEYLRQRLSKLAPDEIMVQTVTGAQGRPTAAVYARWGAPRTVINAHLDTVAVTSGWLADPFRLRIEGERLIGLGAADTKGAIAAVLVALEQLPRAPRDCAILFSGDEEQANTCLPAFLTRQYGGQF